MAPDGETDYQRTADGTAVEILFSAEVIAARVQELAHEIAATGLRDPVVVPVLKGSLLFAADLLRALHAAGLAVEVDFLTLGSYGDGTQSSGRVRIVRDLERDVAGRDVLLIDDILESGRTLAFARHLLLERGAAQVTACVLLDKTEKRVVEIDAEHTAFTCPDVFVVGYGMDFANRLRELPYVGRVVEPG